MTESLSPPSAAERAAGDAVPAVDAVGAVHRPVTPDLARPLPAEPQPGVADLLAPWVHGTPGAPAVVRGTATMDYASLWSAAGRIRTRLLAAGAGGDAVVAVTGRNGPGLVAAMVAVLTGGGVLLTLDPRLPRLRRRAMLARSGAAHLVVADDPAAGSADGLGDPLVVPVDPDTGALTDRDESGPAAAVDESGSAAYLFFTSGTTGEPKGVRGRRAGLVHFLRWQRDMFAVGPADRAAGLTGLSFDVVLRDTLLPLTGGGTLVVPEDADVLGLAQPLTWLADHAITLVHAVPTAATAWVNDPGPRAPSLRVTFFAGEPLTGELVRAWRAATGDGTVVNLYGPTETTLAKLAHVVPDDCPDGVQPIGRPMPGAQVLLTGPGGLPCDAGEIGEIVLRTPYRSLGLLDDVGRSPWRPNPAADDPDDLLYPTGDLGRFRPDGILEILGRADRQVKIRGVRVEPDEVAAVAAGHPSVTQAVVAAVRTGDGPALVCYAVAPGRAPDTGARLREHLAERLPSAAVPSSFVFVDSVPLTANGKTDWRALPAPERARTEAAAYVAPRTATERRIAGLVASLLGRDRAGAGDDFFALGGHSLLAVRLVNRIRAELGAELTPRTVFDAPTVAALAERVDAADAARPPLAPVPRPELVPLSSAQRRLWFLQEFDGPGSTYNVVWAARITGALDRDALAAALGDVVARHESLRTVFPERDGEPYQRVLPSGGTGPGLSVVDTTEDGLDGAVAAAAGHVFALTTDVPVRATLLRLSGDEHVLVIVTHHIVADGGSTAPLARDLSAAYRARCDGRAPDLPPLPVQYADVALRRQRARDDAGPDARLDHWRRRLAGAPELLELPTDRPRPARASHRGDRVRFRAGPDTHRRLADLATATGATVFMVLHAALAALLTRTGAGTDVPVGAVAAGRDDEALDDLVGLFVNTLVLRTDTSGDPGFRELLSRVREVDLDAYDHQDVPFERLVEALNPVRSPAHHPLFQVVLTHENGVGPQLTAPGLVSETYVVAEGSAKLDLSFFVWEARTGDGGPGGIEGYLDYATDLFDRATAEDMAGHLVRLLDGAAAEPDLPISRIELLSDARRHELLTLGNDTAVPVPAATVPDLFAGQARRVPDATAVVAGADRLGYAALDARANRLARELIRRGAGPERFVCVLLPTSVELVVAMLAVLKAGAAHLAVDPGYPAERIAFMVEDAAPVLVLTTGALRSRLPDGGEHVVLDDPETAAGLDRLPGHPVTDGERTRPLHPRNPAFVVYTSGSTGRPKGVVVEHHSLGHYLAWSRHVYPGVAGRALVHSSVSFDLTVTGLYAPLTAGGTVELVELDAGPAAVTGPEPPTFVKATPSHLPLLITLPDRFSPTGQLVLGGEPLPGEVLDEWRARHPGVTVYNEYGPTETTVGCMERPIEPGRPAGSGVLSLGVPCWNTRMYVLDGALRPVPFGVTGEIYIAGELVTRGYHGRPGLTAGRFVADPFGPPGSRMYRSGDLGRRRRDGEYEFAGRVDDQVKVRGFRVEPGEIEAVVGRDPGVDRVAVIVREDRPGDRRLVAYVVPVAGTVPDAGALRARCADHLPEYMVPSAFVPVGTLPLTPNGKLDRRALPAPEHVADPGGRAPRSAREEALCALFAQTLDVPRVGIDDNFFSLGGHSLLAVRLISRIRTTFGVELALRSLFESATVAALAGRIDEAGAARPALRRMPRPEESP